MLTRRKARENQAGQTISLDYAYSDTSGTFKVLQGYGAPAPLGAIATALPISLGTTLMFFNADTAVHYVAFGVNSSMAAPSSPANGMPIPPGALVVMNSGPTGAAVRSDSSQVYAYSVGDESYCTQPTSIP